MNEEDKPHQKKKLTLAIDKKLRTLAEQHNINLSALMEEAIVYELGRIQTTKPKC